MKSSSLFILKRQVNVARAAKTIAPLDMNVCGAISRWL